jgi:hypothetical protein
LACRLELVLRHPLPADRYLRLLEEGDAEDLFGSRAALTRSHFTQLNFGRRGAKTLQMAISARGPRNSVEVGLGALVVR